MHAAHGLPERHCLLDGLVGEREAARPSIIAAVMSFDTMIGIQRRRRRMHHVRLVEARMRNRAAAVADVQQRGLRQRGQQLVRGVRGEDRRALVVLRVAVHGVAVPVDRIEARVGVPGLVEVDAVDGGIEQLLHASRVVAQPVVGGVGDDRVDRRGVDALVTSGLALMPP